MENYLIMQRSHSIFLSEHNYSSSAIGFFWGSAVISEIIMFIFMARIIKKWNVKILILGTILITAVRWFIIGFFVDYYVLLFIAQILHAITYGVFHATSIMLIAKYFKGNNKSRGQAIYLSLSYGLGGAIGSALAGFYWDKLGGTIIFNICMLIMFIIFPLYYKNITKTLA
ncbi:MAG: hypothetical protein DRQ51_05660 [Gammaproteobacteria bacterium]|nr:MAG: hypothetical protein DRQ51_05660 [Gammaproteobacteria bacterium]